MTRRFWMDYHTARKQLMERTRQETDAALARERAAAAQIAKAAEPRKVDVLQLVGVPALVGYSLEQCTENPYQPWTSTGVTLELETAQKWVGPRQRALLVKVYRLPDGSLVNVPEMNVLKEIS